MQSTFHNHTGAPLIVSVSNVVYTLPPGPSEILCPDGSVFNFGTNTPSTTVTGWPGIVVHVARSGPDLDVTTSPASTSDAALFGAGFAAAVAFRTPFLALAWFRRLTTPGGDT